MTEAEELYNEFTEARHEMEVRRRQFDTVEPTDYASIDIAIYLMRVSELRFKRAIQQLKRYGGEAV